MDDRLFKRLEKIESSIQAMRDTEHIFLKLEAHRKVLAAQLYVKADGKSVAEKEAQVYSSKDWIDFMKAHVNAETEFNNQRRMYELRLKAYDAEHLTLKTEAPVIKRQGA